MRRVVFNQKGGVGKTSIACNLAAISAFEGFRTLVVDLDAHANATHYLTGLEGNNVPLGIADFFKQTLYPGLTTMKAHVHVHETPFNNLHLIAASAELGDLQSTLETHYKTQKLSKLLDGLDEDYERIYIDTPPGLNFYSISALIAADRCLIPFDCDSFSRQAIYAVLREIEDIRGDHNEKLQVEGIVVNQYQVRKALPQRLLDELISEKMPILPVYLMSSVKMRESHRACKPLIYLDPQHKLSQQFEALFDLLEE